MNPTNRPFGLVVFPPQPIDHDPPLDPGVMSHPMPIRAGPAPPEKVASPPCAALHSIMELPLNGAACGYPKSVKSWSRDWFQENPASPTVDASVTPEWATTCMTPRSYETSPLLSQAVVVVKRSATQTPLGVWLTAAPLYAGTNSAKESN